MAENANDGERQPFVPQPLTEDQVDYAYEMIDEIHPIEKYPIYVAFPYLKWVTSKCCYGLPFMKPYDPHEDPIHEHTYRHSKEVHDEEAKDGLLPPSDSQTSTKGTYMINGKEYKKRAKKVKKKQLSEQAMKEEPIAQLGFGIVAYIGMLYYMIWAFFLYTLLLIPVFMFYARGDAYNLIDVNKLEYAPRTLGALGYSSYACQSIPVSIGKFTLQCDYGQIGAIAYYGVNQPDAHGTCINTDENDLCAPDSSFADVFSGAVGQTSFQFDFTEDTLWSAGPKDPSCVDKDAYVFTQFTCVQSESDQHLKYNQMATTVAIILFIAYLFTISIRHLYQGGKIQQLEWDMATITAGDYTVELKIGEDEYRTWYNHEYRKPGGDYERDIAPAMSLKSHLTEQIESILTADLQRQALAVSAIEGNNSSVENRNGRPQMTEVKIADIVFSFRNTKLIEALRKRGQFIANQKFDKMREQDQVVNDLFQDFDSLTVPVSAFVTFEEEDGKILAEKTACQTLVLGKQLKFHTASEPTDIIWENRHFTSWDYLKRQSFAFVVIGILLFGSFIIVFLVASYSSKIANTYPVVDCNTIESDYGTQLEDYAVEDYDFIQQFKGQKSSGCLQCYCQKICDGDLSTCRAQEFATKTGDQPICKFYYNQVWLNYGLVNGLSYVLTIVNFILRTVCIMLIDWIGYATETERLSKTTTVTFLVQFFNTAFLLLLVGANLSEQPITFWLTGGQFSDFNSMWFRSIGNTLIGTMWFNAWFPILEALMYLGLRLFFRILDRGCSCDKYKTKKTSIQAYLDTYTGPVYLMHYKYSAMLNIVFVTFMYGLGMPILFPIACLSMVILYFQEKLMLYYGYRVPPMYDERLSQNVLNMMQSAPILMVIFGYWMAGSQQLLSNDYLEPVANTEDTPNSDHKMFFMFTGRGWHGFLWPMMLAFYSLIIIRVAGNWLTKKLEAMIPWIAIGDIDVDEDIDNYWAALDEEDRKWSQREEQNARGNLNMPLLTQGMYDRCMKSTITKGKTLQGVHSYDILANPLYLDDFQYVTAAEDDREEMIIDDDDDEGNDAQQSDFVRVALNLAFLSEKDARQFRFDKRQMDELKKKGSLRESQRGNPIPMNSSNRMP